MQYINVQQILVITFEFTAWCGPRLHDYVLCGPRGQKGWTALHYINVLYQRVQMTGHVIENRHRTYMQERCRKSNKSSHNRLQLCHSLSKIHSHNCIQTKPWPKSLI